MISFVNFARIASNCVDFDLGTLHGYFVHQDVWPNLNFSLEYQIKHVLIISMRKTTLAPRQLLRSVHIEKNYLGKVTRCCTTSKSLLEVAPGQRKTRVNSYRRQTVHLGKFDSRASKLPRVNQLSRDHVNSPLVEF